MAKREANLKEVKEFFGYKNLKEFKAAWELLGDKARKEIKEAVAQVLDGSK